VVVLSHEYWTTVRASDPAVIGKPVLVNGHAMSIIGVAPSSFRGLDVAKVPTLWIPVMMKRQATPDWDRLLDRRAVWMHVFGRLKPGVTAEQAQAGLQPWFQSMLEADAAQADFSRAMPIQIRQFFASTVEVLPAPLGMSPVLRDTLSRPLWGSTTT
jgi:putative ABC transport system permease protein